MSWRDDLQRVRHLDGRELIGASFRGVPFFVASSERAGGRRAPVTEFPGRDDPYVDDLGRKARAFAVEAYVIGDSYVRHRDALLSALEDVEGPGELVHPYHGVRRAVCIDVTVRESAADGGIAVFAISFQEAPDRPSSPVEIADLLAQVDVAASAAVIAVRAELEATCNVLGLPEFALESANVVVRNASAALYDAAAPLIENTQALARMNAQVGILDAQVSALVRTPGQLLDRFLGAILTLADSVADAIPSGFLDALFSVYDAPVGADVGGATPTRLRERANQLALTRALRRAAIVEAARRAPRVAFPSIQRASAARDEILRRMDEQLAVAEVDAFPALQSLRAAVALALPGEGAYARELTIKRHVAIPSLLLSHQLYGSSSGEADLVARNETPHPGFMGGDLKALSDA